jgi:hypothetical protein
MKIPRKSLALSLAPLALALLAGCAHAPDPVRVRLDQLGTLGPVDFREHPLVLEVREGDVIPIDLAFQSELAELTPPAPGLAFRARRRFFLRISGDGLAVSLDGVHFNQRPVTPGTFALGLGVHKEGARFDVRVHMPTHPPADG